MLRGNVPLNCTERLLTTDLDETFCASSCNSTSEPARKFYGITNAFAFVVMMVPHPSHATVLRNAPFKIDGLLSSVRTTVFRWIPQFWTAVLLEVNLRNDCCLPYRYMLLYSILRPTFGFLCSCVCRRRCFFIWYLLYAVKIPLKP